jgi:Fe-S oxidoreductase
VVIEPDGLARQTVFYFPGCGSERLYSTVSLAAIHILVQTGTRVILPPPFLCCGFPARVNAKMDMHRRQSMRTAIILNQIREYCGHLDFSSVAFSCGICRASLADMDVASIFRCRLKDVSLLAIQYGLAVNISPGCLYHAPCHDSLDGEGESLLTGLGQPVAGVPHCCGEAGTLALSRPDIAAAMRARKRDAFKSVLAGTADENVVLTNCPACLSGLGRNESLGFNARHLAEELAVCAAGKD